MQDPTVIEPDAQVAFEVVISKPKAGTSMAEFLEADAGLADFIATQAGYLDREVGVSAQGDVFVVVRWASLGDAEAAGAAFMTSPSGQARMAVADTSLFAHFIKQ